MFDYYNSVPVNYITSLPHFFKEPIHLKDIYLFTRVPLFALPDKIYFLNFKNK